MTTDTKYDGFKDLPQDIFKKLKKQIVVSREHQVVENPKYSLKELQDITDAWIKSNNAISHGVPNQLYDLFIKTLDVEIAYEETENHDLWLGHEGIEYAIEVILERAEKRIEKLKKCRNWSEEKFHRKFLWIL